MHCLIDFRFWFTHTHTRVHTHTHVEERQWRKQSQSVQRRLPRPSDVNTAILRGAPHRDQKYRDLYEVTVDFKCICNSCVMVNALNLCCHTWITNSWTSKSKLIGVSLSEPHIDHDNSTRAQNNGIYVSMYVSFTPHLMHPGSRDPCMPWNASCILVYWCAHVRDLQLCALDWTAKATGATRACCDFHQRRHSWTRRHMVKRIQPTETMEL